MHNFEFMKKPEFLLVEENSMYQSVDDPLLRMHVIRFRTSNFQALCTPYYDEVPGETSWVDIHLINARLHMGSIHKVLQ